MNLLLRAATAAAIFGVLTTPVRAAQDRMSTLRIAVVDQTRAVIVGASVSARPLDRTADAVSVLTNERGEAVFGELPHGRYEITIQSPGFEAARIEGLRFRGNTRREVTLALAKLAEEVTVERDPRERATDPRGNSFGNVLTPDQIDALPDDPDEMEEALKQMAGPGAVIRVDGFRGGKLPPKSQIRGIRLRRDMFAAEYHGGGMVFVDILTNPGGGPFRGSADVTFRDESLNARNPMAPRRGPEQQHTAGFTASGTLWKNRTGFSFSTTGATGFDSRTILAALPGERLSDVVRRPSDRTAFTARLDHSLSRSHTLRASYQRNGTESENLGVGDFDLPERAYSRDSDEDVLRLSFSGPAGRLFYNESRFQVRSSATRSESLTSAPALLVLDSFNRGGAQIGGGRHGTEIELASDIDFARGPHSMRAGLLLEAGSYRSDDVRNAAGTFTFASLDAFLAGRPTTFSQRTGDPLVEFSHAQLGWYVQDDIRVSRSLSLSLGVRHEVQTHADDAFNLAPRASATWSPFRNGKTIVRGGFGIFYDWYDSQTHEQTLRVDGSRQSEIVIRNPGYPNPMAGGSVAVLPSGRIVRAGDLKLPTIARSNVAIERALTTHARVIAGYSFARGSHLLRGRNVNAPDPSGARPDPSAGNLVRIESTGRSDTHVLHTSLAFNLPWHRLNLFANYALGSSRNDTDGAFSLPADSFDPAAEWGPSAMDARHRASALLNMDLWKGFRLSSNIYGSSGLPYNVTTGFDDNGDTVSNDRPSGVGRNSERGKGRWDVGARLSWTFGFGTRADSGAGPGPQVVIRTIGGPAPESMGGFSGGAEDKRWRFEIYVAGTNLLNRTNPLTYSGVMTSPFFGQFTSAAPGRRLEVGTRFYF